MLLHLPIVILTSLSPIAVSDTVPQFDITRECRFEGGSTSIFNRCLQDENAALSELRTEWAQSGGIDHQACVASTRIAGFTSYVELMTCLEMARSSTNPNADAKLRPTPAERPGDTVGEGR